MSIDVGSENDFQEGSIRICQVDGREVGVVRVDEELFAVQNVCPHQDAPLCKGAIRRGLVSDTVGDITRDDSRAVITCPWHGWAFDLRTGLSVTGDSGRVRLYDVKVQNGRVLVEPRRRGRAG